MAARKTAAAPKASPIANVAGAVRIHPRAPHLRPISNEVKAYDIVHGAVCLQDPEKAPGPGNFLYYYPGETVQLTGVDAEPLLKRGIIVEHGKEATLKHTIPDRDRPVVDLKTGDETGERVYTDEEGGRAKLVQVSPQAAAQALYETDSSQGVMRGITVASAASK